MRNFLMLGIVSYRFRQLVRGAIWLFFTLDSPDSRKKYLVSQFAEYPPNRLFRVLFSIFASRNHC